MTTKEEINEKIKSLQVELDALKKQDEEERKTRMAACKRVFKFEMRPETGRDRWVFDPIWDNSVKAYQLRGTVTNKEACIAAGHSEDYLKGGSMAYLFNACSGKLITSSGGGTIYINRDGYGAGKDGVEECKQDAATVVMCLGNFLAAHPDGGDVTHIITAQRHFRF